MNLTVFPEKYSLAKAAASEAARTIRDAIRDRGTARIIAATGAAQFEFLDELTKAPEIDWKRVEMFHLDEYIGLPANHAASFRKFLQDRLISKVGIIHHHLLDGENPENAIAEATAAIRKSPVDVAFVGVGENGHLAFNDPPADFESEEAFIVVELDDACRRQQLGEGWFKSFDEVPHRAISMTVREVLRAKKILCIVPDARKAAAVAKCFAGPISPMAPASSLRTHPNVYLYLDKDSAALLNREARL